MRILGLFLWFAAPIVGALLAAGLLRLGYVVLRRPAPPFFVLLLRGLVLIVGLAAVAGVAVAISQGR
jgi:hypothetical protein